MLQAALQSSLTEELVSVTRSLLKKYSKYTPEKDINVLNTTLLLTKNLEIKHQHMVISDTRLRHIVTKIL